MAAIGFGGIVFVLIESVPAAGAVGAIALIALLYWEARAPSPMIPLHLFRSRNFAGANLLTLFLYSALSGVLFFFPLNLIQVQGYSPTAAGAAWGARSGCPDYLLGRRIQGRHASYVEPQ